MSQPRFLNEIGFIRAIAILGVIAVHSSSSPVGKAMSRAPEWLGFYNFFNLFFKFGTPTFIFLSSFVLFYNYYKRPFTAATLFKFYKNRFLYIVIPYIMFSAIYFVYKNYDQIQVDAKSHTLDRFLNLLLWGNAHAHLYFVFISIQFYLMFPLFLYIFQRVRFARIWAIPIGFALQWAFVILNRELWRVPEKGSVSFGYMSFFCLGIFVGIYYERIRDWLLVTRQGFRSVRGFGWLALWGTWLAIAFLYVQIWYTTRATGVWAHALIYEAYWSLHAYLTALVVLQLALAISVYGPELLKRSLIRLSGVSFGVYLLHPLVLAEYRYFEPRLMTLDYHLWAAGAFVTALGISWLVVWALFKIPFSWILVGKSDQADARRQKNKESAPASMN